jgi:hypothetical protein
MVTKILDTQIRREKIPISMETAHRLDIFCVAISVMKSDQVAPQVESLREGLIALGELFLKQGSGSLQSKWLARFHPSRFGSGGTLSLEDFVLKQQLTVCRDYHEAFYSGTWSHAINEQTIEGLLFNVIQSRDGYSFEVTNGGVAHSCYLGNDMPGVTWAQPVEIEEILPDDLMASQRSKPINITMLPENKQSQALPQPVVETPTPAQEKKEYRLPLLLLIRQKDGHIFALRDRLTIGRGKENKLVLEDNEISRKHAVIEPTSAGWLIKDLNSTNGTWLNGVRITNAVILKAGDRLEFGKTILRLELSASERF